jgi:hypothetical protein
MFAAAVGWTGFDNYDISCNSTYAFSLSVPALERVGSLIVCSLPDNGLALPQLRSITGPMNKDSSFENPGIQIGFSTQSDTTTAISIPALEDVRGNVRIYFPAQLAALTRIDGVLMVENQLDLPALQEITGKLSYDRDGLSADGLTTIGGPLLIAAGVTGISLPSLTTVKAIKDVFRINQLAALELPALTTVTGTVSSGDPGSIRIRASRLTTLSFPLLPSLPGNLEIEENTLLTSLDFPLLETIGSSLSILSNTSLPSCYATDLLAQLQASGWTGTWSIAGNNGTGTCP